MENKVKNVKPRTDLALEVRESFNKDNVEVKGVELSKKRIKDINITTVVIKDKDGENSMQKPMGKYITIEAPKLQEEDKDYHKPLSKEIAKYIKELTNGVENKKVLIAGLGNRKITPDSLGPLVVDNLFVTRHLIKEFGDEFKKYNKMEEMSAIAPGVMAQTGMETSEILKGIIRETKVDLLIVIDALAARSIERLNTTIQITDTGISPGSGVGNHRNALDKRSLGVNVIAIGVPTVVDAGTIVEDTMNNLLVNKGYDEEDTNLFLEELDIRSIDNMFVTPNDIDESVKRISYTISEALNICFYEE